MYYFSFVIKIRKDQENKIYFLPELSLELHHPSNSTIHLLVAYDPSDRMVVVNTLETFSELIISLDHIQHQMKRRHIILLAFNENTWWKPHNNKCPIVHNNIYYWGFYWLSLAISDMTRSWINCFNNSFSVDLEI